METISTATLPAQGAIPPASAPGQPGLQSAPKSTPEQRAKWRAKRQAQQERKSGLPGRAPAPSPGAALSGVPAVAGAGGALVLALAPVLWSADHLRPIVSQCIPVAESLDLSGLKKCARAVSPEALALVESQGHWNPVAKTALNASLPECLAKWLNALGVSAENKEEITVAGALVCIFWGSYSLRQELRKMASERKKAESAAQPQEPNADSAHK